MKALISTHNSSNRMFTSWLALLMRIIDNQVQKKIVSAKRARDFSSTLQVHKELLVHKLKFFSKQEIIEQRLEPTFLSSG